MIVPRGAKEVTLSAPALAVTGYATSKDSREALLAGFQMHVAKPVDPAALIAAVASLAERRNLAV